MKKLFTQLLFIIFYSLVFDSGNYSEAGQDSGRMTDQRKGTLVIHNNTNATLTISATRILEDPTGLFSRPKEEVEVPPGERWVLSNFLPRGNVEVTAEARKTRPKVLPISEQYWISGAAKKVREWEIFPEYFGKSFISDSPIADEPSPVIEPETEVDGCVLFSGGFGYRRYALYDHIINYPVFIEGKRQLERLRKFALWGWSDSFQKSKYENSKKLYKISYPDLRKIKEGTKEEVCREIRNLCGENDWRGPRALCY